MLRDRNCDRNFERSLLAEIKRIKIAARKMHKHGDLANFKRRNQWFNGPTISVMASDYLNTLKDYVEGKLMYRLNSER